MTLSNFHKKIRKIKKKHSYTFLLTSDNFWVIYIISLAFFCICDNSVLSEQVIEKCYMIIANICIRSSFYFVSIRCKVRFCGEKLNSWGMSKSPKQRLKTHILLWKICDQFKFMNILLIFFSFICIKICSLNTNFFQYFAHLSLSMKYTMIIIRFISTKYIKKIFSLIYIIKLFFNCILINCINTVTNIFYLLIITKFMNSNV